MLLHLAVADAYGFSFEYAVSDFVHAHNDVRGYRQHPTWPDIKPGVYSDDSQMSIAVALALLSDQPPTALSLANLFVNVFRRDPRKGYSGRFYDLLLKMKGGPDFLRLVQPQSSKSGGAMRAVPCGILPTIEEAVDFALHQASLTHATKDGMGAAGATAALAWACRHGCDRGFLPQFLNDVVPGYNWGTPWTGPVGAPGLHSVKAALAAVVAHDNLHDILRAAVAFTGDVDTVAAIAIGSASLHPNIESNLSQTLYDGLEPGGKFGVKYLIDLDAALFKKYSLVATASVKNEALAEPEAYSILDMLGPGRDSNDT